MANILVVDDDQDFHELLSVFLESIGHHVVQATDPIQMSVMIGNHRPDLIVLDIEMPAGGGETSFRAVQSLAHATPVIFCSGVLLEDMQRRFPPSPKHRYINKPVNLLQFKGLVDQLLKVGPVKQ